LFLVKTKYLGNNQFCFLNITHKFESKINWNFPENGKLWNYNLQYFDFLNDEAISVDERLRLIREFNYCFLNGTIKPEPFPTSLRIVNVIAFVCENDITDRDIIHSLQVQLHYLECNLEFHILANHLLENIYALFIGAVFFNNDKLLDKADKMLKDQLDKQILSDGAHYERSVMYHTIMLAKLCVCIDVTQQSKKVDTNYFQNKAALMVGWLNQYSFPDGSWALFNDAALEITTDTKTINQVLKQMKIDPIFIPMNDCGFRKMSGTNWEALLNVGNIQPSYQPGHSHADMLSSVCGIKVSR
jgi:uncharacterized heparinase superfamily protein